MKERRIEHQGIVEVVRSQSVVVSVMQETACSACSAAQLCHGSQKQHKSIEVLCDNPSQYAIGQNVILIGRLRLGFQAILWAYVVPLFLLVAMLMVVSEHTGNEGKGAMAALFSLIPYYIVLYLLRNRLQRTFSFRIQSR